MIIEARDPVKRFEGSTAVDHISFAVPEGAIFGFLGPNGAGKTTTIKMLTTCSCRASGGSPSRPRPSQGAAAGAPRLRIVFQDPSLDGELTEPKHGIARRPLPRAAGRAPRSGRGAAALRRAVGAAERLCQAFSAGMRRRLEIARALQHRPRILFLDEPTVGLDPQTRNQIWESIRGLCREERVTVFFTTHYMEEAERVADGSR